MANGVTLEQLVNSLIEGMKDQGDLEREAYVTNVKINHPTDPTKMQIFLSNGKDIKIDLDRPMH